MAVKKPEHIDARVVQAEDKMHFKLGGYTKGKNVGTEFQCHTCGIRLKYKNQLEMHVLNSHNEEPDTMDKNETIDKERRQKEKLKIKITKKLDSNNELENGIEDPVDLKKFIRKEPTDKKYYCTLCNDFSQKSSTNTRNHVEAIHFPNMFSYHCEECDKPCSTMTNYAYHKSTKHGMINKQIKTGTINNLKTEVSGDEYKCENCDFKSKGKNRLQVHTKIKHEGARFQCSCCEFHSANIFYMKRHIQNKHKPDKLREKRIITSEGTAVKTDVKDEKVILYECEEIDIKMKTMFGQYKGFYLERKENLKLKEEKLNVFKCTQCYYRTNRQLNLKIHSRRMHQQRSADISCSACPFVTVDKSYLWLHMRRWHSELATRKSCRTITHKEDLPEHSFRMRNTKPNLVIEGFSLIMNKYNTDSKGHKYAYFYCGKRGTQNCKASGKAIVDEKSNASEEQEGKPEDCSSLDYKMNLVSYSGEHTHTVKSWEEGNKPRRRTNIAQKTSGIKSETVFLTVDGSNESSKTKKIVRKTITVTKNPDAIDEGYSIKEPSDLKQFVRKDQNSLKYHCTLCTTFSQKSITNTRNHVEADHFPNMFTYHCDQCDEKLSNKNNYATHNASTHNLQLTDKSDDDNLTCDLCGHLSASRFALYTHRGNTHQLNEF